MQDKTLKRLAEFVQEAKQIELTNNQKTFFKNHLVDTFGCAIGAINSKPAKVARQMASSARLEEGCTVFGSKFGSTPEYAAFANTAMVRYLDYNDTGNGGHPSDTISAILALAEENKVSNELVAKAINASYETYSGIRKSGLYGNLLRKKHIDQIYAVIAGVVGCSVVLDLNLNQAANAISLALTPNIPMRAARTGKISYWKSTATSHSALMSVFSARLSKFGMTGPEKPFEGSGGFYQMFDISPLNMEHFGSLIDGLTALESTGFKKYPANYNAQGPAEAASSISNKIKVSEIKKVEVYLHWGGYHSQGGGAGDKFEKWNPQTREEAENSMAYVVAASLLDGDITYDSFDEKRVLANDIKTLIHKIDVMEDAEITKAHEGALPKWPSRISVFLNDDTVITEKISSPKGHPLNPMTENEINDKFYKLSVPVLGKDLSEDLNKNLRNFFNTENLGQTIKKLRL